MNYKLGSPKVTILELYFHLFVGRLEDNVSKVLWWVHLCKLGVSIQPHKTDSLTGDVWY